MMKIEGTKFSAPTFEPTATSKQFAAQPKDTIAPAKAAEETEGCFTRLVCAIPRALLAIGSGVLSAVSTVIRTAICILTLGYYCNTKAAEKPKEVVAPSEKELRAAKIKDLEEGLKIWEKQESTAIEKGAARDAILAKHSTAFEDAAELDVERLRFEYTKKDPANPENAEYIKKWNEQFFKHHKEDRLGQLVNGFNTAILSRYIERLRVLNAL